MYTHEQLPHLNEPNHVNEWWGTSSSFLLDARIYPSSSLTPRLQPSLRSCISNMLIEFDDLPRCNCGAVFLTEEELKCHTQETETSTSLYKELVRFASAQLERLRIHSPSQDNDDAVDARPCAKHKDSEGQYHCPKWGCDFKADKPNQLLRHYGRCTHVKF